MDEIVVSICIDRTADASDHHWW